MKMVRSNAIKMIGRTLCDKHDGKLQEIKTQERNELTKGKDKHQSTRAYKAIG
jgi:ribosomal protein S17E